MSEISDQTIDDYINDCCLPQYSHEINQLTTFTSKFFGKIEFDTNVKFYSKSHLRWLTKIKEFAKKHSNQEISQLIYNDFKNEFKETLLSEKNTNKAYPDCFNTIKEIDEIGLEKTFNEEWGYVMKGLYGICLKEVTSRSIVIKKIADYKLTNLLKTDSLPVDQKQELQLAIDLFNSIASDFGPHEIKSSSRECLLNAVIRKFDTTLCA
ncbi:MAG: DUF6058 family natural product biosynthesis protein [Alphaproteobacteria bacterium]|nr:DUF6058 family natural product biosynthesis protein [Alphaproteobacteria bacterium]